MPQGKPLDGRKNPGWTNPQSERERNNFKLASLPCRLLRKPEEAYAKGMELVEKLKVIEAQLTIWEDAQDLAMLELLPWWEERKKYREQKALGNVPEVEWWQALAFLESAYPSRITRSYDWGLSEKSKGRLLKKKARKEPLLLDEWP